MLILSAPILLTSQIGKPKPTQLPKDAGKNLKISPALRLPRVMLVPMTTDLMPVPSPATIAEIDKGFRKGWEESAKEKKGRVYDLIPYDKTMAAIEKQPAPVKKTILLEGNPFVRWETGKMVSAAKSLGADFVLIPNLTELSFAKDKDQVECRGYLAAFPMDKPYPVIAQGWLGGQWNNSGAKTPFEVARTFARVDIPRRMYEDYIRERWPSVKK